MAALQSPRLHYLPPYLEESYYNYRRTLFCNLQTMHLLLISLSFLLWQNAAAKLSDPMTTAAPIRPTHENLRRQSKVVELQRKLGERAAATSTSADEIIRETLEYCYGEGSICVETNALYDQCDQANPQPRNDTKIEICKCENGYFAADQE
jgi:hypothetical protein